MKQALNTEPNILQSDDFYALLIETHRELSDQQTQIVNARLILLLSNHIGDLDILKDAMRIARADI